MTTATVDIGTFITRSEDIRGGRPRIAGAGVTVQRIVGWYQLGLSPDEIAREIGHLPLAQVYAALAYYHANREEIDAQMEADQKEGDRVEREYYKSLKDSFPSGDKHDKRGKIR